MTDSWNIGTLNKMGIWSYYVLSNYIGVFLCGLLIQSVYKNKKRQISDLFIGGTASACLTMSITCGTQCLVNMMAGRFVGSETACQIEAIAHISSILTQFVCVSGVSLTFYQKQVLDYNISHRNALIIVVLIWISCTFITCILSLISPIYLMSAGTYCFFGFNSVMIVYFLVPGLIIALIIMLTSHILIMRHYAFLIRMLKEAKSHIDVVPSSEPTILWRQQFKWRSTMFIITLLLGWSFAAITAIYELSVGKASEWLVTAVGTLGTSYSWMMPLTYSLTSESYKEIMVYYCGWVMIPCKGKEWYRNTSGQRRRIIIVKRSVQRPSHEMLRPFSEILSISEIPSILHKSELSSLQVQSEPTPDKCEPLAGQPELSSQEDLHIPISA